MAYITGFGFSDVDGISAAKLSPAAELEWSNIAGLSGTEGSDVFITPDAVDTKITAAIGGLSYMTFKGSCLPTELTDKEASAKQGDVWDMSDDGTINADDDDHKADVKKGDNVAWVIPDGGTGYWDLLGASIDVSVFATKTELSAVSAELSGFEIEVAEDIEEVSGALSAKMDIPEVPDADGDYVLAVKVTDGTAGEFYWVQANTAE